MFLHFKYHVNIKNVIFTGKFHMFYFFHRLFTCFSHVFHPVVIDTPLVIQIPHTYVNQPLQNVGEVVILTNKCMHHAHHDNIVGEHTMMDRNNPITLHDTIILCCRGFHKDCSCNCLHTGHRPLHMFVKSSNALLAPNHLFLHDWPYDHEPQDQLKPVQDKITHTCIGTEQRENIDENERPVGVSTMYHLLINIVFGNDLHYLHELKHDRKTRQLRSNTPTRICKIIQ